MKILSINAMLLSLIGSGAYSQTLCPSQTQSPEFRGQLMHVCGPSDVGTRDARDHVVIPLAGLGNLMALSSIETADFVQKIAGSVDESALASERKSIERILDSMESDAVSAKRFLENKIFKFQNIGSGKVFESMLPLKVDSKTVFPLAAKRPIDLQPTELWDESFVAFELVFDDEALSSRVSKALNLPIGLIAFRPAEFLKSQPGASTLARLNQMRTQGAADKPFVAKGAFDLGFHRVRQIDNVLALDILGGHLKSIRAYYEFKVVGTPQFKQAPAIAKSLASNLGRLSSFEDGFLFARELIQMGVIKDSALAMILDRAKEFPKRFEIPGTAELNFLAERAELLSFEQTSSTVNASFVRLTVESFVR